MDEESPAADLTPAAVRRRFTAAAWGSAAAWPVLSAAVALVLLWWLDIDRDKVMTADFAAAGLLPLVLMALYLADDAVRTVRKEQKEVAENACGLAFAAHGGDPSELRTSARHFGNSLLQARSAFNTRVLPRQTTLGFARRVLGEAEGGGLSPASLRAVEELAGMAP
ncbi:hypothetical protein OG923_33145 (plasmid) [Streptomyces halstedii]|uniref:hypothetical protein n=1 Tax=Streptomyces halstedii TaxID=1944 RepID=UPI002F90A082